MLFFFFCSLVFVRLVSAVLSTLCVRACVVFLGEGVCLSHTFYSFFYLLSLSLAFSHCTLSLRVSRFLSLCFLSLSLTALSLTFSLFLSLRFSRFLSLCFLSLSLASLSLTSLSLAFFLSLSRNSRSLSTLLCLSLDTLSRSRSLWRSSHVNICIVTCLPLFFFFFFFFFFFLERGKRRESEREIRSGDFSLGHSLSLFSRDRLPVSGFVFKQQSARHNAQCKKCTVQSTKHTNHTKHTEAHLTTQTARTTRKHEVRKLTKHTKHTNYANHTKHTNYTKHTKHTNHTTTRSTPLLRLPRCIFFFFFGSTCFVAFFVVRSFRGDWRRRHEQRVLRLPYPKGQG